MAGIFNTNGVSSSIKNKRKNNISSSTPTSSFSSSKGNSSPTANTSANTNSGIVKTNTSYNGSYLDVDLNTDYAALAQKAASSGDYTNAARYEAMRNAKIKYLDSVGNNINSYKQTNDYVKNYGYSNNQGGTIYTNKTNSISDLPSNWTYGTVNGANYKKDGDNIYIKTGTTNGIDNYSLVGQGVNPTTGEFTFNNANDARTAAYDRYLGVLGYNGQKNYNAQDAYNYIDSLGLVDPNYIAAVQNGTVKQYDKDIMNKVQTEEKVRQQAALTQEINNSYYKDYYDEEYLNLPVESQQSLDENSFETDYRFDEYYDYMQRAENNRMRIW